MSHCVALRRPSPYNRIGRDCRDFLLLTEEFPDTGVVQTDTVIGKKGGGEKCLLTIHFPVSRFMLAFLRDANTARSVTEASFQTLRRSKRTVVLLFFALIHADPGRFQKIAPGVALNFSFKHCSPMSDAKVSTAPQISMRRSTTKPLPPV
jgi:hypothetical protein